MYNNPLIPGRPYMYDVNWIIQKLLADSANIESIKEDISKIINQEYNINSAGFINVLAPIYPLKAVKGDGITDDWPELNAIIEYAEDNNLGVLIPAGVNCYVSRELVITSSKFICEGAITPITGVNVIIQRNSSGAESQLYDISKVDGGIIIRGLKNAFTRIQVAQSVTLEADGNEIYTSMAYNCFIMGFIRDLKLAGYNGGWINSNIFIGGRFYNLDISGDYSHNCNNFYSPLLEGADIDISNGFNNYIHNARCEALGTVHFGINARGNIITRDYNTSQIAATPVNTPYTDDNGSNVVINSALPAVYKKDYVFNKDNIAGYMQDIRATESGIQTQFSAKTVFKTNKFQIESGTSLFIDNPAHNLGVLIYCYDENGAPITTQPANAPFSNITLSWNGTKQAYEYYSATGNPLIQIGRYNSLNDSGVKYVHIEFITRAGATGEYIHIAFYYNAHTLQTPELIAPKYKTFNAAPSSYYGEVGDIVYNSAPAAGSPIGWICTATGTPGTWAAFPNL